MPMATYELVPLEFGLSLWKLYHMDYVITLYIYFDDKILEKSVMRSILNYG